MTLLKPECNRNSILAFFKQGVKKAAELFVSTTSNVSSILSQKKEEIIEIDACDILNGSTEVDTKTIIPSNENKNDGIMPPLTSSPLLIPKIIHNSNYDVFHSRTKVKLPFLESTSSNRANTVDGEEIDEEIQYISSSLKNPVKKRKLNSQLFFKETSTTKTTSKKKTSTPNNKRQTSVTNFFHLLPLKSNNSSLQSPQNSSNSNSNTVLHNSDC